jgi:mannose-P-dolichol utilization defect protein 1
MSSALESLWVFLFASEADQCSTQILSMDIASFVSGSCFKMAVSKAIGMAIFGLSILVKAPTIANIVASKKAVGFSPTSLYLDVIMYSNAALYGFLNNQPITLYGDTATMLVSSLIIVVLYWKFNGLLNVNTVAPVAVCYAVYLTFVLGCLQVEQLQVLQLMNTPVLVANKVSQIILNFKLMSNGSISLVTLVMQGAGPVVKIGTTLTEVGFKGNEALLFNFGLGATLNGILVGQWIYNASLGDKKKMAKKEKSAPAKRESSRSRSKTPAAKKAAAAASTPSRSRSKTPVAKKATPARSKSPSARKPSPRVTRSTRKKTN